MNTVTIPIALAAGVVSFASPCFLPIVPVYVGYMAGRTAGAAARAEEAGCHAAMTATTQAATAYGQGGGATATLQAPALATPGLARAARWDTLRQASAFVLGFSLVFVGLWASIGVVGYALGEYRSWLRMAGGAVLIVMGLHVAGLIEIGILHRSARPISAGPIAGTRPTLRRSALLGVAFGAGWSPCIGPILGAVIGMASVSGTVAEGAVLLAAYCLGLGIPFVLVALGADAVHRHLRGLARHETAVSLLSGGLLIVTGFLMITDLFGRLTGVLPTFGV